MNIFKTWEIKEKAVFTYAQIAESLREMLTNWVIQSVDLVMYSEDGGYVEVFSIKVRFGVDH